MREIKFRAWDDTLFRYHEPLTLEEIAKGNFIGCNWYQLTLEQYIGLKDKNGKEIYEGDIVHHKWSNPSDWIITFKDGCFGFYHEDGETFEPIIGWEDDIEVIGNIHES